MSRLAGGRRQKSTGGRGQLHRSNCHRSHILTSDTVRDPLLPPEVCHCVTPLCDIAATPPALHTTTLRQWQRERSLVWPRDLDHCGNYDMDPLQWFQQIHRNRHLISQVCVLEIFTCFNCSPTSKSPTDPFPEFYFSDLPPFPGQIFL